MTPDGARALSCDPERVAQLLAHRACGGVEHDPMNGKLHGYCVVCLVPWPCEYAGKPATPDPATQRVLEAAKAIPAHIAGRLEFLGEMDRLVFGELREAVEALAAREAKG